VSTSTGTIRESSMVNNPEYQHLREEHARYDALLDQLASRRYLTEQEQMEEVRLKKLKLRVKDQMERLMRQAGNA
jgi:uncharacterized protein YdcH (DUF465 family)